MRCTDTEAAASPVTRRQLALATGSAALLAACSSPLPPDPGSRGGAGAPARPVAPGAAAPGQAARPATPSQARARNWDEYRAFAARRLIEANPTTTYLSTTPDPLLAIPVLEVELSSDGSIRNIVVMREPRQAKDTIQLAIAAVRRAAPFGDVSHLPRPWKFVEVFLFDDNRKFKPRTLDV